ncbi:hypothetical protein LTR35_016451 [Friedmanniomyces endolithicus]|uniref:D-arabinitol 2-dehydrogenase [ribulose-forming] n=1 Tax=Friedmanniomyces endolithicus TaxID=329885 RepID=A0AAN6F7D3_9PEZI|nr:hypothetical protein LTR35_016451 [Friedmanniomyces endolithicus]KAK0273155.1 hypothetical protein LTS00_015983 [Friedmanniomyces endolithicus]KAK0305919.1 hypothetical protein LTR82_016640 [Friedmanniomyces endolithicus]KAK0977319.1 hypothetical protein LTR54_016270 [Friedmanniomyces endolithicus]
MLARARLQTFARLARPTCAGYQTARLGFPATLCSRYNPTSTRLLATTSTETTTSLAKYPTAIAQRLPDPEAQYSPHRLREFELNGRVYVVTGDAQGLGLTLAEALVEAGGKVYCLDIQKEPTAPFYETQGRVADRFEGTLSYRHVDVQNAEQVDSVIAEIAAEHSRLDGLIAAAGIQYVKPALEYPPDRIQHMMNTNFGGVFLSAVSCARQMIKYNSPGAMVLVGSMSGLNANKGFTSSVYNSSKAAVIQLGRNLAMEWGKVIDTGGGKRAIRVNVLCPGNIITPMVLKNFEDDPGLRKIWEENNMLGRISEMKEYRGAALFMLSDASSFMTGSHIIIDGGYTAW